MLVLDGVLEGRRRRPSADEVGEIISAWHRTYSSARWTLLSALEVEHDLPKDHIVAFGREVTGHADLKTGLLLLSVVGFHSVFDQIAFGLNSYLHLKHRPASVNFSNMWLRPGQRPQQPGVLNPRELHPALKAKPLPPLTALYWLSRSLQDGAGLYRRLRELRNQAEHHVTLSARVTSRPSIGTGWKATPSPSGAWPKPPCGTRAGRCSHMNDSALGELPSAER